MDETRKHLVFAYGSLQRRVDGRGTITFNDPDFEPGDYVGDAVMRGVMLARWNGWAALVDADGYVQGEVYQIDDRTLRRLDRREGVDRQLYKREAREVTCNGETMLVWVYTMNSSGQRVDRRTLTHTWPVEGIDSDYWVNMIRKHEPLVNA